MKPTDIPPKYRVIPPEMDQRSAYTNLAEYQYGKMPERYKNSVDFISFIEGYITAIENLGLL